ncbi:MAG: nucleotidyltransferase family protein [Candidatus Omnitrophota bacterium]
MSIKALILAAGRGARLGGLTEAVNKCMLNVQGRPLLEYSLTCAAQLPLIEEIVVVVGYHGEEIQAKYGSQYQGKDLRYVRQENQAGLVQAIACAEEAIGSSDFMLMLGDEFMSNPHHEEFLNKFINSGVFGLCGVVKVNDRSLIQKTYAVILGQDGHIVRLIEKPARPEGNLMGTGNCIFRNQIFSYIPVTPINQKRQEKELPDLIQCAVDEGHMIKSFLICKDYVNVNSKEELDLTKSYFAHL